MDDSILMSVKKYKYGKHELFEIRREARDKVNVCIEAGSC